MRTLDLALKNIRQIFRDRRVLLFLVVMPVVFTFFFGFMFGTQQSDTDPRYPVAVINQDADGLLSGTLIEMLETSAAVRLVQAEGSMADLEQEVRAGSLSAVVRIPNGFSDGLLSASPLPLDVVLNTHTQAGQTVAHAIRTNSVRLMGVARTAQTSLERYEAQTAPLSAAARQDFLKETAGRSVAAWQAPPLAIEVAAPNQSNVPGTAAENPYNQFSPGMLVQFAIFGLTQIALVLVLERRSGAMQRLLTTSLRRAELIAGHLLSMFLVVFVQGLLLVTFGQLALGVDYLREPLAMLLVLAGLSLWVSTLGLLIATLVKKEEQVILVSMAAMFIFSALGGVWFSLEFSGSIFSAIGRLTPAFWAMNGFQNILVRGMGLQSVLQPVGMMLVFALAFFGLSLWRFKFE
jgi:ABC-2 type transport system permease protein